MTPNEDGRPKKVRNSQPKQCKNERRSARKRSKPGEHGQKSAKTTGVLFVDRLLGHFPVPYSGGPFSFFPTLLTRGENLAALLLTGEKLVTPPVSREK